MWVHISIWFWFWFEPYQNQPSIKKRTKNEPKIKPTFAYNMNTIVRNRWSRFHRFFVRFWFIFGPFLMLVRLQKPHQNQTKIYKFVVWFWFCFVWFKPKPKPNGYMYSRRYVHNNVVLYSIFLLIEMQTEMILVESETYSIVLVQCTIHDHR